MEKSRGLAGARAGGVYGRRGGSSLETGNSLVGG